jgi:ABC-type Fe3+-siderophore transport system permease subunit
MMKTKIGININKQRRALFFCIFFLAAALVSWVPCA